MQLFGSMANFVASLVMFGRKLAEFGYKLGEFKQFQGQITENHQVFFKTPPTPGN